jgi:hypothetical protein
MTGELRFVSVARELDHVSKSRQPNDIVTPPIIGGFGQEFARQNLQLWNWCHSATKMTVGGMVKAIISFLGLSL